jgi:hypothetical protein
VIEAVALLFVALLVAGCGYVGYQMATAPYGYEDETGFHECDHDWMYDEEQSKGPWTGYIESCPKCGAIVQVPQ